MRLIDADALKNSVLKWLPPDPCGQEEKEYPFQTDICVSMMQEIEDAPTIEPERKTGRWLSDNRPGGGFWVCSCCKFPSEAFAANVLYKFCPNCGADMRGGEDEA